MADICYDTKFVERRASSPATISRRLEDEAARGFDAVRQLVCLVWWDGSAIGLRLNGFIGLFGGIEPDAAIGTRDELA